MHTVPPTSIGVIVDNTKKVTSLSSCLPLHLPGCIVLTYEYAWILHYQSSAAMHMPVATCNRKHALERDRSTGLCTVCIPAHGAELERLFYSLRWLTQIRV